LKDENVGKLLRDVDAYVAGLFAREDEALAAAVEESRRAGLPEIHVSASQGRLLGLLAEVVGARRMLEVGTLGGYSAIHLARALPRDGALVSLELEERHAEVARRNLERAGLAEKVEVRVGDAVELLSAMARGGEEPFDLVFIDADKQGYPEYLEWAVRLSRPGALVLADNVIRGGGPLDPRDETDEAIRAFNEKLAADPRLSATIVPLVRERVDGLAVARVLGSE
jgi:caffeoyl-CoA O-methyltransferase